MCRFKGMVVWKTLVFFVLVCWLHLSWFFWSCGHKERRRIEWIKQQQKREVIINDWEETKRVNLAAGREWNVNLFIRKEGQTRTECNISFMLGMFTCTDLFYTFYLYVISICLAFILTKMCCAQDGKWLVCVCVRVCFIRLWNRATFLNGLFH